MSLDLSVITDKKISDQLVKSVNDFLQASGFCKDEYGYYAASDTISVNLYVDMEPEIDEFWTDDPPGAVWFMPLFQIALEARHNIESHETSYRLAGELANLLDGFVYDNQVGVVYDSDGQPYYHYGTGRKFEKYGAGIGLFMGFAGLMRDILGSRQ